MRPALFAILVLLSTATAKAQTAPAPQTSSQSESRRLLDAGAKYYHDGQIDESLDSYQRAILLLSHQQRLEEAFAASMTVAAIESEAGRHIAAAERYRKLALNWPKHSRAAEAHRQAILSVAHALRNAPPTERPPLANGYANVLEEHLIHWNEGPTVDDARLWKGQLLVSRGEWVNARETLQAIAASAPQFPAAVALLADSYQRELEQLSGSSSSSPNGAHERASVIASATKQLLPLITGKNNRWPESWSDTQREVALTIARMHLEFSAVASPYAERLLAIALGSLSTDNANESSDSAAANWKAKAQSLLIVARARAGKIDEAQSLVVELRDASPDLLLSALHGIHETIKSLPTSQQAERRKVAGVALALIHALDAQRDGLHAEAAAKLNLYRANVAVAAGDQTGAIAEFAELAASSPQNMPVQIEYAELLTASPAREHLRTALVQWQNIESRCDAGSREWRRARSSRIGLLNRLGERDKAEKLTRLTELLYPDWASGDSPPRK